MRVSALASIFSALDSVAANRNGSLDAFKCARDIHRKVNAHLLHEKVEHVGLLVALESELLVGGAHIQFNDLFITSS